LIFRFIDPEAEFIFVPPTEVVDDPHRDRKDRQGTDEPPDRRLIQSGSVFASFAISVCKIPIKKDDPHRDRKDRERAKELDALPYDAHRVELTHDGELCSFDGFLEKYH
jgi:hypothetical protein